MDLSATDYARTEFELRDLPYADLPYTSDTPPDLTGGRPLDEEDVAITIIGGVEYDHPVEQGQYGLVMLDGYVQTGNAEFLRRAELQAARLMEAGTRARGALYFPYRFEGKRHGFPGDLMEPPWYSAMAQGQALSLFVRLHEVTGTQAYREAADLTFASFENLPAGGDPWTVFVDDAGFLWLEEYAKPGSPDFTLNGHIFALYGLYDYHRVTRSPAARNVILGALTTLRQYADEFRVPDGISHYCLAHRPQDEKYHHIHVGQFRMLHTITGHGDFLAIADELASDFPNPAFESTALLQPAEHLASNFEAYAVAGRTLIRVADSESFDVEESREVRIDQRRSFAGHPGVWLRIDSGPLSGYWLEESQLAHVPGIVGRESYSPARPARLGPGAHTGYRLADDGSVTGTLAHELPDGATVQVDARAVVDGVTHLHVVDGPLAGSWLPESSDAALVGVVQRVSWAPGVRMALVPGTHTGRRLAADGQVLESREVQLAELTDVVGGAWAIVDGTPHVEIQEGELSGYWVDAAGTAPAGRAIFEAGRHTGFRRAADGSLLPAAPVQVARSSAAEVRARVVVDGQAYLVIGNGAFAGQWVPESEAVVFLPG